MSRKSTPSPSIISKRRQNNVSNTAILQVVSKREPFMNINDLVKYISENPTFYNLPTFIDMLNTLYIEEYGLLESLSTFDEVQTYLDENFA